MTRYLPYIFNSCHLSLSLISCYTRAGGITVTKIPVESDARIVYSFHDRHGYERSVVDVDKVGMNF